MAVMRVSQFSAVDQRERGWQWIMYRPVYIEDPTGR